MLTDERAHGGEREAMTMAQRRRVSPFLIGGCHVVARSTGRAKQPDPSSGQIDEIGRALAAAGDADRVLGTHDAAESRIHDDGLTSSREQVPVPHGQFNSNWARRVATAYRLRLQAVHDLGGRLAAGQQTATRTNSIPD